MKVDGLGVILAMILLPIISVVTYYIQIQVDTIATENQYNTKLLNATYDAMSAFEINTANEELSSVADSMRSIILASNNILFNSLATNFGISNASKEYIQPYVPAVLYTMYDGYYIYSPTETPKVAENKEKDVTTGLVTTKGYLSVGDSGTESLGGTYGDIVYEKENGSYTLNSNDAKKETDYILKSYVQYSARYKNSTKDITINYTLDNYLNIMGKIGNVYYTKTGYLIKDGLVDDYKLTLSGLPDIDLKTSNEDDIKNKILGLKTNAEETTIKAADSASLKVNGIEINSSFGAIRNRIYNATNPKVTISTISEAETYLKKFYEAYNSGSTALLSDIQNLEYEIQRCKAVAYYASSACFSNWVYDNLKDLTYNDIQDGKMTEYYKGTDDEGNPIYDTTSGAGKDDLYYNFHNGAVSGNTIFKDSNHPDPEDTESNFNTHKMEVIKNSIKYNLNLSMSAYNKMDKKLKNYEASMPVLLDEEWDKILSNISIVSFMQGWDCGLDIYNNYQIVSSTNNELTVTPTEIYYVPMGEFSNSNSDYHRIDCPYLSTINEYISFKSKEVKYDKIYDSATEKYRYDHKNLACYRCINSNNYVSLFKQKSDSYYTGDKKYTSYYDRISSLGDKNKIRAGYIGIAKERQNIYKTNALPVSEGYEIVIKNTLSSTTGKVSINSNLPANKVKKLQITFSNTTSKSNINGQTVNEPTLYLQVKINDGNQKAISIPAIASDYTLEIDVSDINLNITKIDISKSSGDDVAYKVKNVKAIYK